MHSSLSIETLQRCTLWRRPGYSTSRTYVAVLQAHGMSSSSDPRRGSFSRMAAHVLDLSCLCISSRLCPEADNERFMTILIVILIEMSCCAVASGILFPIDSLLSGPGLVHSGICLFGHFPQISDACLFGHRMMIRTGVRLPSQVASCG
ncbi:uncharacterized protein SEPMUDRAFT_146309 [Sphaerulina musiva SO2202]|uniref:Uncharacterized protein n=1 Tax=Sphaerulina musiva (strain SO2202) TaxID=692275 RepID=N1QLW3_SPHMS|nr:uncharacterized protein SEPMUDRAFT_146309 [Sphaerulina musiva SO2202]EMF17212.1 hypothetical protein SEPMUDRAFT_146309 [Sphaerulina musiva SO2202]